MKNSNLILEILDKYWFYYKTGSSFVTRCPFCKENDRKPHNAQVNTDTLTLYCYSEKKTYTIYDLRVLFGEIKTAETKTEKKTEADIISSMRSKGYELKRKYEFFDLDRRKVYEKLRFENSSGEKAIVLCKDGVSGLSGTKQIPYGIERVEIDAAEKVWVVDDDLIYPCEKIFLTEGEKCKEALEKEISKDILVLSFCKPSEIKGFEKIFKDKDVTIFEDNDNTGRKNTEEVVQILKAFASTISVVSFPDKPEGYDVADYIKDYTRLLLESYVEENIKIVYKSPLRQIDCDVVTNIKERKKFILEPFVPTRSVCLFDGLGETGKSLLAMQMGLCVAYGLPFLCLENNEGQRNVLYITAEDTRETFNERLKLIKRGLGIENQNSKTFFWISTLSENFMCESEVPLRRHMGNFVKTEFYEYLRTLIQGLNPCLIVFDSLVNFYGLDENSSEHASAFMNTLKFLIREQKEDMSFLLLHHQTKVAMQKNGDKVFRGSMVFREQSRCRFYIQKEDDIRKKILIEKLNAYTECQREYDVVLSTTTEIGEPCLAYIPVPVVVSRIPDNAISTNDDADDDDTDMVISDNDLI